MLDVKSLTNCIVACGMSSSSSLKMEAVAAEKNANEKIDKGLSDIELKIKAAEHCMCGTASTPPTVLAHYISIYEGTGKEWLGGMFRDLEGQKTALIQQKLLDSKGT